MQKFSKFNQQDKLNVGIPKLYDDLLTVLSNSSGDAFPTDNLQVGMTCYRTDLKKAYRLISNENNNPQWKIVFDVNFEPGIAERDAKGNIITDHYISIDGGTVKKPIRYTGPVVDNNELPHKSYVDTTINAAKAEVTAELQRTAQSLATQMTTQINNTVTGGNVASAKKLSTARKINGVVFDGTSDITINASDIENTKLGAKTGSTVTNYSGLNLSVTSTTRTNPVITSHEYAKPKDLRIATLTLKESGLNVNSAFTAGTYTLAQVLQILINNCHGHTRVSESKTVDINCINWVSKDCDYGA